MESKFLNCMESKFLNCMESKLSNCYWRQIQNYISGKAQNRIFTRIFSNIFPKYPMEPISDQNKLHIPFSCFPNCIWGNVPLNILLSGYPKMYFGRLRNSCGICPGNFFRDLQQCKIASPLRLNKRAAAANFYLIDSSINTSFILWFFEWKFL